MTTTTRKPAAPLPNSRHFDCMKRCPMDCRVACKRVAYHELVAALHWYADTPEGGGVARNLLRKLGEST